MGSVTVTISADGDDGYSNGTGFLTGTVRQSATSSAGLRFQNVAVPAGVRITQATLSAFAKSGTTGTAWGNWYFDKVGNAPAWSSSSRPDQITKTSASTPVQASTTPGTLVSVDVTPQAQEVFGLASWASGNAVRVAGDNTGTGFAVFYDVSDAAGRLASLTVTWAVPSLASASITFAPLTTASASKLPIHAVGAGGMAPLTVAATAKLRKTATANITFAPLAVSAYSMGPGRGRMVATFTPMTVVGIAKGKLRAQASITFGAMRATAIGWDGVTRARFSGLFDDLSGSATGKLRIGAGAAIPFGALETDAHGALRIVGQADITFSELEPGIIMLTGDIIATSDQTIIIPATADMAATVAGLPRGAVAWKAHLDPSDRSPRAVDFTPLLNGAKIADVRKITMSAAGAAVGLMIDGDPARQPIIGTDGQKVQFWFLVTPDLQESDVFADVGVQVGVAVLIETDAQPAQTYERTGILTVRQL